MVQLQLANITLVLGARRIFENLNWEIQNGQKIGLIGANGAGKSSLFKMIEGDYAPELGGAITRARQVTTGYLSQSPELDLSQTALEAAVPVDDARPAAGGVGGHGGARWEARGRERDPVVVH